MGRAFADGNHVADYRVAQISAIVALAIFGGLASAKSPWGSLKRHKGPEGQTLSTIFYFKCAVSYDVAETTDDQAKVFLTVWDKTVNCRERQGPLWGLRRRDHDGHGNGPGLSAVSSFEGDFPVATIDSKAFNAELHTRAKTLARAFGEVFCFDILAPQTVEERASNQHHLMVSVCDGSGPIK